MKSDADTRLNGARAASTIVLLAGIWFFVSPWVYGAYMHPNAWNSWIVGAAMFILGCIRVARPAYSVALGWCNMVLGIWAFCSPWIYSYTGNAGRFINSLCVGVVVFVLSIVSARLASRSSTLPMSRA
jgi:SPW repeat